MPVKRKPPQQLASLCLEARAEIQAAGEDPTRPRDFKMVAYTGGLLHLPNYDAPVVVDLNGMQWPTDKLPIRARHNKELMATIGQTTNLINDRRQLLVDGFLVPSTDESQHIVKLSDNGFEWQASIEAKLLAPTKYVPAGQTIQANGQTFHGPLYLAPKTRLQGIGFVELGADTQSSAAIAASLADSAASSGGSSMTFESWLQSQGIDPASLSAQTIAIAKMAFQHAMPTEEAAAEPPANPALASLAAQLKASATPPTEKPAEKPADKPADKPAEVAASMEQLAEICAGYPTLEADGIDAGWTVDFAKKKVRTHQLREQRPEGRLPPTSFTGSESRVNAHTIQASMLLCSGMTEEQVGEAFERLDTTISKPQREKIINCAMSKSQKVTSFSGVFRRLLASKGMPAPDSKEDLFNEAIYASQMGKLDIEAAGGQTMVSLPGIFGDFMNKKLLAAYEELPSVIPMFCQEADANDFRTLHNFRLHGIGGEMYELGVTGELKTVAFREEEYTNRLKTRGFMLQLPRELIINDDLQATNQIPTLIGRNARRTRERIGFRTLLRAYAALFTSDHANLLTGAGSVLAADGQAVRDAIVKQSKQKDANGDPIMLQLDRIICGSTLGPLADDLYNKDNVQIAVTGTAATPTVSTAFTQNRVKGKLQPVVSPFMDPGNNIYDTDGTTDLGSDTKWIAACDPKLIALVQFVYLNGKRSPTVETRADASFNTLGMSWRCYWDINASPAEYRAGVGSNGA